MLRTACILLIVFITVSLLPLSAAVSEASSPSPRAWYRLPMGIHDVWVENNTLLYIDYTGIWSAPLAEPASPRMIVGKRCSGGFFYPGGAVLIDGGTLTQYVIGANGVSENYTGPLPHPYLLIRTGNITYLVGGGRLYVVSLRGLYVYTDPELDPRYTDIRYSAANETLYLLLPRTWYTKTYYLDHERLAAEALIPSPRTFVNTGGQGLVFIDSGDGAMKLLTPTGTVKTIEGAESVAALMKRFLAAASWGGRIYVYGETLINTSVLIIDAASHRLSSTIYYRRLIDITRAVFWNHTIYVSTADLVLYDKNPFSGIYTIFAFHRLIGWKIDYTVTSHLAFSSRSFVVVIRRDNRYTWAKFPYSLGHPAGLGPRGRWAAWVIGNETAYGVILLDTVDVNATPIFIPTMSPGPAGWPAEGNVVDGSYMRVMASGNDTVLYNPGGLLWLRGGRYVYGYLKQLYSIPTMLNDMLYYIMDGYLVEVRDNGSTRSFGPVSYPDMLCILSGVNNTIYALNMMLASGPYTGYVYPYSLNIVVKRNNTWMISHSLDIADDTALYRRDLLYSYAWLDIVRRVDIYAASLRAPVSNYYPSITGSGGTLNALRVYGVVAFNSSGAVLYRRFWRTSYAVTLVENALVPGYTTRYMDTYMSISGILLSPGTAPAATHGIVLRGNGVEIPNSTLFDAAPWGAVYVDIVNASVLSVVVETNSSTRKYTLGLSGDIVPGVALAAGEPGFIVSLRVYGEKNYTLLYGRVGGAASLMELDENYRAFYGPDTLYVVKIYSGNYTYAEPRDALIYRVDPGTVKPTPFLDPGALNVTLLVLDPVTMRLGDTWFMSPGLVHAGREYGRLWVTGNRYFIGTLLWSSGGEVYVLRLHTWGNGVVDDIYVYRIDDLPQLPRPPGRREEVVHPLPEPAALAPALIAALFLATALRRRGRRL